MCYDKSTAEMEVLLAAEGKLIREVPSEVQADTLDALGEEE